MTAQDFLCKALSDPEFPAARATIFCYTVGVDTRSIDVVESTSLRESVLSKRKVLPRV